MGEICTNYRGIDYSAAMVEVSPGRFPDLCFHEMDARHLTFADDSFDLVTFSHNGINSVDLAGRLEILREVHRFLSSGGYVVFSALSRSGPAYDERWPDWRVFRDAASSPSGLLRAVARLVMGGINRWRCALALRVGSDVAIGTLSAHNFVLITLFISVGAKLRQLDECGLCVEAIFERPVDGLRSTAANRRRRPGITTSRGRRDQPVPNSSSRDRLPEPSCLSTQIIFNPTVGIQNQGRAPGQVIGRPCRDRGMLRPPSSSKRRPYA